MPTLEDLRALNEDDFTNEVIKPLLEKMGYKGVRITHGSEEFGKDVIFYTLGPFDNKRWGAAQLKVKKVHGGLAKKGNYEEVKNQLNTALRVPHPDMTSGDKVSITETYLITSEYFTENSKEVLIEEFSNNPVFFIDGETVLQKVKEHEIPVTPDEKFERSISEAFENEEIPSVVEFAGEKLKFTSVSEEQEVE